jgi:hypothetical protein
MIHSRTKRKGNEMKENTKKRKRTTHVEYLNFSAAAVVVAAVVFSSSVLRIGGIYCFCGTRERAFALFCVALVFLR